MANQGVGDEAASSFFLLSSARAIARLPAICACLSSSAFWAVSPFMSAIFARQNGIGFGALFARLIRIIRSLHDPITKLSIIFDCRQQIRDSFESLLSLLFARIALQHPLVGGDRFTCSLDIVGLINARLVLLMDNAGDK